MNGQTTTTAFHRVNALTQEQRDAADIEARKRIAGNQPTTTPAPELNAFVRTTQSKYPAWVSNTVTGLSLVMVGAAFIPSAIRLHAIALATNLTATQHVQSAYVSALCTVLLAETGQIAFSVSAAFAKSRLAKVALNAGSIICLAIALSGNASAMGTLALGSVIAFLETFAPPILVVITANILKSQFLNAIAEREAAHVAFIAAHSQWTQTEQQQRDAWQYIYDHAETHSQWEKALVNALRDALRSANRQSKAVLRELTTQDWIALVVRERNAEEWWTQPVSLPAPRIPETQRTEEDTAPVIATNGTQRSGRNSTALTGDVTAVPTQYDGSVYFKVCPDCGMRVENATERGATNALVAHRKRHVNEERKRTEAQS